MFRTALLALLLGGALPAQDQATTMLQCSRRADVVVRVTVTAVTDPSPEWRRLQFHTDQVLKGTIGSNFSLTEPAGKCCGRSLFALQVGESRLLFLQRVGPVLHTCGGPRGVLPTTPAIVAHTQALLGAADDAAASHVLAAQLANTEPRIANDAALALAVLPGLQLNSSERLNVVTALHAAVLRGSTRSAALADIAARIAGPAMLDSMLPIYLQAKRPDQARLLQRVLVRCPTAQVAQRLPMFVGTDRRGNLRAAELLTKLPPADAQSAMTVLLQRPNHPQIKMHLCEGLLCAGVVPAALERLVPEPVLQLARQRVDRATRFRNVTPHRR